MSCQGVSDPTKAFSEIEKAARQEIIDLGGSLSHHHGIGKIRSQFLSTMNSATFQSIQLKIKEGLDPKNIFAARNGAYAAAPTGGASAD